jgi:murein DD-endopeptidase MepM/ murein hydrolase activator NlpD
VNGTKRRGVRGTAVAILAVALLLASGATAWADPRADKSRIDRQLQETQATLEAATERAQRAAAAADAAAAALPGAEQALEDATGRVIGAEAAARQAERDSAAAKEAQLAAGDAYQEAAGGVDRGREAVSTFVAAAYKGTGFLLLNSVLEAGSPSEIATRIGYLDRVAADQRRTLDALTRARFVAKQRSDAALLAHRRAEAAAETARRAYDATVAAKAVAQRAADDVHALIDKTRAAEAVANQERAAVLARYNALKLESEQVAAELRRVAARSGGGGFSVPSAGAFFLMPVHGWKTSNFGMRYDPYYHVWQLHAGVDLAAGGGQPIEAAADGRVVRAGWSGGYGNYTCLYHGEYHGKGLATCYGHQSQILVSVGEFVRRGQVIGRVGTTGASTGYHLHFEVRLDGTPIDPLGWLPACLC